MINQYQEPISKDDLKTKKKFSLPDVERPEKETGLSEKESLSPKETLSSFEPSSELTETETEKEAERTPEEEREKSDEAEKARRTISVSSPIPSKLLAIKEDAASVALIQDYEKKISKLINIALAKGPEHAIKVARHLDRNKDFSTEDNYTLDEVRDKMTEEELRNRLIKSGLLKEL